MLCHNLTATWTRKQLLTFYTFSWRFKRNFWSFDSWRVLSSFRSSILYPLWYMCLCNQHRNDHSKFGFFLKCIVYWIQIKCRAEFQHLTGLGIWILAGKSYISLHFLWIVKKLCVCVFFWTYSQLWNYNVIALKQPKVPIMGMNYNGKYQERHWALFGMQLCFYLGLSFASGSIRISLNQPLLHSKFTCIHALTSPRRVESSTLAELWPPWEKRSFLLVLNSTNGRNAI